jgi:hypothetical protein
MANLKNIAKNFVQLNLFRNSKSNETTLYDERLSTRLYLLLLNMIIFGIFFHMLFAKQMTMFTIN